MSWRDEILARFAGDSVGAPLYLPDLTAWYDWHSARGTMPSVWQNLSLPDLTAAMGVPAFVVARPWRRTYVGTEITTQESDSERVRRVLTPRGALQARWSLGPDEDWWQLEYPAKTVADLACVLEAVSARSYQVDEDALSSLRQQVGEEGLVALELPKQPYSELLHEWIGWSEGLMLLADAPDLMGEILCTMEAQHRALVSEMASLEGPLALAADNLDGQYISPRAFEAHMAAGYCGTAEQLHAQGRLLLVHVGGPVRRLLPGLSAASVDGVEGVCGSPQGDTSLAEARLIAGPQMTLWGGIAQDVLLPNVTDDGFREAVRQAAREASEDPRAILGVADRVPVQAVPSRLAQLADLIAGA